MNREGILYTILFVFIASFLFVFLLSLTNQATIEQVQLNAEIARQRAVLSAFGIEATTDEEVQEQYALIDASPDGYLVAEVNGETAIGHEFSGPGLWGTIRGVLAVNADVTRILGLEIVSDNETPGLGARINEEWFKEQFRDEVIGNDPIEVVVLEGDGDPDRENGVVDAVTGATRTSEAMGSIINNELEYLRSLQINAQHPGSRSRGGDT
jgi:Na+-transporting NADH:ubiquinone oxidoreductase subunit C